MNQRILLVSALALAPVIAPAVTISAQAVAAAKSAVADSLKDPSSVQFRDVHYYPTTGAVCGQFNARNSFGGYVGFSLFKVDGSGALADIVSLHDLSSAYRRAAIKQFLASCDRP